MWFKLTALFLDSVYVKYVNVFKKYACDIFSLVNSEREITQTLNLEELFCDSEIRFRTSAHLDRLILSVNRFM